MRLYPDDPPRRPYHHGRDLGTLDQWEGPTPGEGGHENMEPSRMPRYDISNDGMGPYAIFYCDRDEREYRSNPSIGTTIKESVQRGALGGFLRNIPIVGKLGGQ